MRKRIYLTIFVGLLLICVNKSFAQIKPETMRQIQSLLQEKAARTPAQRKMDSRLLQAYKENAGKKMADGVDLLPAMVNADASGSLKVDINGNITDALLLKIKTLGGQIIYGSKQYHALRVSVPLSKVETIAGFQEVRFIQPAVQSMTVGSGATFNSHKNRNGSMMGDPAKTIAGISQPRASPAQRERRIKEAIKKYLREHEQYNPSVFQTGSINSQGDHGHRADDTRNAYGYLGQGIKIGVLSDSYNALGVAAADVTNGDLPGIGNPYGNTTPVTVLADYASGADEGRAMLQIVHDLAPKAQLFFATADNGEASFATNIISLRNTYACDIIIDDVYYFDEPVFEDGVVAQAVNTVTAAGALYFSSAGNEGSVAKGTAGVWEGDFKDAGAPTFTIGTTKIGTIHNFSAGTDTISGNIITAVGGVYNLNWADALGASSNDYDLFLLSSAGVVKGSSTNIQNGAQDPYEQITAPTLATGDRLVVFKSTGAQARAISLNTLRGRLTVATTGQTHGHSAAVNAFSVAAAPAATPNGTAAAGPFPGVFTTANQVETFTSDGPRRVFYNADSTPIIAGNFLFGTNGGTVRPKPDITAADGVNTTLGTSSGLNPFYGTSAAAPHAGAIAALLKSANPALTTAQIRSILTTTTVDIETVGYDNVSGYGIVQAYQAMQMVNPTPLATFKTGTVTATEASFNNGNGVVEPGETGNLAIQLTNPSLANATLVTATLASNTSGVTVTQGSTSYGSIAAAASGSSTGTPFAFAINSSVACGTVVKFTFTVTFKTGASPLVFQIPFVVGGGTSIFSGLGATPPVGINYTAATGFQTGRLNRTSPASSCGTQKTTPAVGATTGARAYDAYTFTNTRSTSACATITLSSPAGVNLYIAAYNDAGYVPASPALNFSGDYTSAAAATQTFGVTVAAGKKITVVIAAYTAAAAIGTSYTLNVTYASSCTTAPACTPVAITTTSIATGATGSYYVQHFSATGGSGVYLDSITGNLPAGLSFAGDSLYGTPTQAGSFAISVKATDPAGCPSATTSYTLSIAGNAPASLTPTAGTPQATRINAAFPAALQATVYDAVHAPLGGVSVTFTAPTTGASGTFTGGSNTAMIVTNASGTATAPTFTANGISGAFSVLATVNGVAAPATFNLTDTCLATLVTSNGDDGPGTLRYIITNSCSSPVITFNPSVTQINLTSGEIAINKALTIIGPGASQLTISGSNLSRIFNISAGAATVSISGMTIRDGKPASGTITGGGGILVNNGSSIGIVNLTGCVVRNNDITLSGFSAGGAIDVEGGVVNIDRSTIAYNTCTSYGGGIFCEQYGSMTLTNSTIAQNTSGSTGVGGGGLLNLLPINITNCTFYGNTAFRGGNIYRYSNTITFKNTIIAGGSLNGAGTGPDIYGTAGLSSSDYNFIQNVTGATLSGTTTHNITGINPKLFLLADYSGTTFTVLPMSNSAVIDAGDPTLLATATDQRGFSRKVGTSADMGAVETNYTFALTAGTPQSTAVSTPFASVLQTTVKESGNSIAGDSVLFSAPTTGASGTFTGSSSTAKVVTDASGIATAPTFTANATVGTYNVKDSIGAAFAALNFVLTNNMATPVTFGAITATVTNCTAQIVWETLSESNSKDFTVEYSTDGVHYTALATLPAAGTSNAKLVYRYLHTSLMNGTNYYRIKQTDLDGAFTYSSIVIVASACGNAPIVAYPNPVKNNLTVVLPGTDRQTITITDAIGRRIDRYTVNGGTQAINANSWAKGMYALTVTKDGVTTFVMKVIKD